MNAFPTNFAAKKRSRVQCPTRSSLQEYLSGWIQQEEVARIEEHLSHCQACEQTIVELERNPETILRGLSGELSVEASEEQSLKIAIDRAKRLAEPQDQSEDQSADTGSDIRLPSDIRAYDVIDTLGQGGMGIVFLAEHRQLGKRVALKLLPSHLATSEEARARFSREVRAAGKLDHPSIVTATDAGESDGVPFLVMEHVEGLDLSRIARAVGCIKVSDACELIRQAALGLSFAHAQGIVHRDLKPSNVMLDETGQVKILDFGLAQLGFWDGPAAEITSVGQLMGTLDYMAPEQAERNGGVDFRSDLYALGAMLFRLLCGRPPLSASPDQSPLEKLRALDGQSPPCLSTLREDAPAALVELTRELLSRDPRDRPSSAAHVAERLSEFCGDSDLSKLLAVARDREQDQEFKVTSTPSRVPVMTSHKAQAGRGGNRPPRRWLVLAMAPLFIFAGITFLIETNKGQLVIESEVDDVSIRLLREGEGVDELQIKPGNESTRLRAGKYEIVIASASDQVVVDQDEFQIKSGETVIVRVSRIEKLSETTVTTSPPIAAGPLEPTYNGRTFAQWSQQYRQERHADSIEEALTAIYALRSQTSPEKLTELLLDAGGGHRRSWQDSTLPALLRWANSGTSYFQLLVDVLDQADASEQGRILQYACARGDVSGGVIKPLVQWIVNNAPLKESQSGGSLNRRLDELLRFLLTRLEGEDFQYLVDQISNCEAFGDTFFLQAMPTEKESIQLQQHVRNVALESIRNEQTSAVDVTLAALILASHSFPTGDSLPTGDRDQSFDEQLGDAVYKRLMSLADDKERMLASVTLPDHFLPFRIEQEFFVPAKIRLAPRPREFMETLSLAYLASSICTVEDRTKCFELLAERTQSQWTTAVEKSAGYSRLYIERWNPMVATWTSDTRQEQPAIGLDAEDWIGLLIHEFVLRFLDTPAAEKEISIEFNLDPKYISYAQRIVARYDKNQDGSLTEDEYAKMLMSPIAADLDKDARVDVREYARWMSERTRKK